MAKLHDELDVFLNETRIGKLSETNGVMSFRYSPEFLNDSSAYPLSQSLPLKDMEFTDPVVENFFSNLLPDERMRNAIAMVLGTSPDNTFGLLKRIGADCAGAVSFYPAGNVPAALTKPVYRALSDSEAYAILDNLALCPLDAGDEGVRISGAGSQEKLVACVNAGTVSLPLYGTPSTHIIKPAITGIPDSVYNEFFCMKLAKICRIPVAECFILHLNEEDFYVVERFDRVKKNGVTYRLHQEDFCQVLNISPKLKYQEDGGPGIEECIEKMSQMHMPAMDRIHFIRLVIFNFLIGNCDAHAKNYAVLYRNGRPAFAPAYDLLSTMIYDNMSKCFAMKIGGENRMGQMTQSHFKTMAVKCNLNSKMILTELLELASMLPEKAKTLCGELNALHPSPVYERIVWEIGRLCSQILQCEQ